MIRSVPVMASNSISRLKTGNSLYNNGYINYNMGQLLAIGQPVRAFKEALNAASANIMLNGSHLIILRNL